VQGGTRRQSVCARCRHAATWCGDAAAGTRLYAHTRTRTRTHTHTHTHTPRCVRKTRALSQTGWGRAEAGRAWRAWGLDGSL
jgi:hypothetical protein